MGTVINLDERRALKALAQEERAKVERLGKTEEVGGYSLPGTPKPLPGQRIGDWALTENTTFLMSPARGEGRQFIQSDPGDETTLSTYEDGTRDGV